MSPLRRCLATNVHCSILHNHFLSLTDAKIEGFVPVQEVAKPSHTLQSAKDRKYYLMAQMNDPQEMPVIYGASVAHIAQELAKLHEFIKANKQ